MSKRGVLTLIIVLGAIGLITFGGFFLDLLNIRKIVIEGGERITTDDVLRMIDIQIGDSLLTADLRGAATRLHQHQWIRAANVSIRFPDVHIKLEDRTPFAVVHLPEQGPMWCDEEGYVLTPFIENEQEADVLMIEGLGETVSTPDGPRVGDEAAWSAVRLVLRSELGAFSTLEKITFHAGGMDLLNEAQQRLRLPMERTSRALRRFQAVWPFLDEGAIKNLDVRFPGEFVYQ